MGSSCVPSVQQITSELTNGYFHGYTLIALVPAGASQSGHRATRVDVLQQLLGDGANRVHSPNLSVSCASALFTDILTLV